MQPSKRAAQPLPTVSPGVTAWTVRFNTTGVDRVHYKVFRDRGAADEFADWWRQRGATYDAFVLPAVRVEQ
jgi:hypothetical protein